jgi:hypothetical protein
MLILGIFPGITCLNMLLAVALLCTVFSCFFNRKRFANMGRLINLRARVQKSIGDVCVMKCVKLKV